MNKNKNDTKIIKQTIKEAARDINLQFPLFIEYVNYIYSHHKQCILFANDPKILHLQIVTPKQHMAEYFASKDRLQSFYDELKKLDTIQANNLPLGFNTKGDRLRLVTKPVRFSIRYADKNKYHFQLSNEKIDSITIFLYVPLYNFMIKKIENYLVIIPDNFFIMDDPEDETAPKEPEKNLETDLFSQFDLSGGTHENS